MFLNKSIASPDLLWPGIMAFSVEPCSKLCRVQLIPIIINRTFAEIINSINSLKSRGSCIKGCHQFHEDVKSFLARQLIIVRACCLFGIVMGIVESENFFHSSLVFYPTKELFLHSAERSESRVSKHLTANVATIRPRFFQVTRR